MTTQSTTREVVARERFKLSSAGPEPAITWTQLKEPFMLWAQGRFGERYVCDLRKILDKHQPVIAKNQASWEDFMELFMRGQGVDEIRWTVLPYPISAEAQ